MTHLCAKDFYIKDIPFQQGRQFIVEYHYAKGCSRTAVYMHGLFRKDSDELLGVAQWLPPTRVAAESVNKDNWKRVLALSRLVVHPDVPTNGASFLMGRSIRMIKSGKKWVSLVTYADDFMGHTGQIYRATNWIYIGRMKGNPRWEDRTGRQVAKKSTVSRSNADMVLLGYKKVGTFAKHKFVLHLQKSDVIGKRIINDSTC